jgi:hypothetical protein
MEVHSTKNFSITHKKHSSGYQPSTFLSGDFALTPQERAVYGAFGRFFKKIENSKTHKSKKSIK